MDDVLVIFDEPVYRESEPYQARARGQADDIGRWAGWLEFSADGTVWQPTGVETVQPNRRDLEYWVTGLSSVYLEGALARALTTRQTPDDRDRRQRDSRTNGPRRGSVRSSFADVARIASESRVAPASVTAILDPFAVYIQGEHVLRAELSAVSADHLRNIAAAFRIESSETAGMLQPGELVERIVTAARGRTRGPSQGEARA